ncbi:MAG: hypothetical protein B7Y00_05285 [Sphingomonadales bacterium 17-56-6]|nr:MAG: hypothetical protein B7Y00_05285 [Sphingomonadales bacterium 17-56-6]
MPLTGHFSTTINSMVLAPLAGEDQRVIDRVPFYRSSWSMIVTDMAMTESFAPLKPQKVAITCA